MKSAVVVLSLALVFLALLEESVAYPHDLEVGGKNKKSSSNIESGSASEDSEEFDDGCNRYRKDTKKEEFSQDKDYATASENDSFEKDAFGNTLKKHSKQTKFGSVDVDTNSDSTYIQSYH